MSARLEESSPPILGWVLGSFKKIFAYIERQPTWPGLVQPQDKIVDRCAITIYPYYKGFPKFTTAVVFLFHSICLIYFLSRCSCCVRRWHALLCVDETGRQFIPYASSQDKINHNGIGCNQRKRKRSATTKAPNSSTSTTPKLSTFQSRYESGRAVFDYVQAACIH